jgi:hypothetical protein
MSSMIDTTEVIRAIMLGLAPKDHRGKSAEELIAIGYSKNSAAAMEQAYRQQNPDEA